MLYVIIADQKEVRGARIGEIVSEFEDSELISVDDSMMTLADLEQFVYPSLFISEVPIVHGRFLLGDGGIESSFAKTLAASPTIFIFEEFALPASTVTLLKKAGATVHVGEKQKKAPTEDIFAATACITASDKKTRWLVYRDAVSKQPIEALLGILYWKLRTLAAKGPAGNKYATLYGNMLEAQTRAWRTGAPLTELIEKEILNF